MKKYPEIELVPITVDGMTDACAKWADSEFDLSGAKRIFPYKSKGEGHFVALFHKKSGGEKQHFKTYTSKNEDAFRSFEKEYLNTKLKGHILDFGDKLFMLPFEVDIDKIKTISAGLFLGVCKKGRFEPSHALCLALSAQDFKNTIQTDEPEKFFRGETLSCEKKGWTAVLYNGFPIGWGKASDGILKNHFPKYLRF